ncbi:DMT family transporter [Shimia sediminis]|uniref:DMT family transporter n=1 Tax=Shimia sediminis TaxID=2497945 RepID=UPI000F8D5783|nr:DMT family transporter [Shimia sediminis]
MNNVRGIFLITLAMAGFAVEDMFVKLLSTPLSTGQILIGLGAGSALIFAAISLINGENLFARAAYTRITLLRAAAEAAAAAVFVLALTRADLSTVAAIFQALPLAITMGGALFLGDEVGWRRWSAITVGFLGVLLIIRPGLTGFEPASLLVLAAVVLVAARDLLTRQIDSSVSSSVITSQGFGSLVVAGLVILAFGNTPLVAMQGLEVAWLLGAILFGGAAYWCLVTAMRIGETPVVAPYRYTRLLFSMILGILVFHERPDMPTIAGASLIILSGLYTFLRERKLAKPIAPAHPDFPAD